ncbi:MAG TPA: sulfite exporter TauE/SafE family protein [Candidatus Avacidaminococcus intestinavium]|uniref:Probable membrane transporter protein n=1 Tax=Candidatus Avacidaminococcus intestinavium TaxID=2840684 RepID=A0A9D1MRG0_9FIRM|nr:sulfite exporter TauE/SafE family protein [Candidatus Avacidaminococcus intestinavium]
MILTLISIGLITGFISGLLGVGGGVILVPLLTLAAGLEQHLAQGISMLVIIPTSLAGLWQLHKKKLVDYHSAMFFAGGAIIGAMISSGLVQYVDGQDLKKVFSIFVIFTGLKMIIGYFKNKK